MPQSKILPVNQLKIDLKNYRTVPQSNEVDAIKAMISINPDRFWALMDSLLDSGYLLTENIIVLKTGKDDSDLIVKEGNRRVAALKLIHGHLDINLFIIPSDLAIRIENISKEWKKSNEKVPCAIYENKDAAIVDRIVSLTHGKSEKAGRDHWEAVARARHNRDYNKASEPALDLLEKYLDLGRNVTGQQKERWSGNYPISVLDEAIKKIAVRLGASNSIELAKKYPTINHRDALEDIIRAIGLSIIRFETIRKSDVDFAAQYGIPLPTPTSTSGGSTAKPNNGTSPVTATTGSTNTMAISGTSTGGTQTGATAQPATPGNNTQTPTSTSPTTAPPSAVALAINDPKGVNKALKGFIPLGNNRQKVVTLRDEALRLNLKKTPIAFCFLLRSMFEISAKAYCNDHGIVITKSNSRDKNLLDLLREQDSSNKCNFLFGYLIR